MCVMNLCLEMCEFEDGEARLVSGFPKVDMYLMAHDVSEVELQSLKRLELGGSRSVLHLPSYIPSAKKAATKSD